MNDFVVSLMLLGAVSSNGSLPFWMTTNRYGIMPEESGALALVQAGTQFDESKSFQWKWGASLALNTYYGYALSEDTRHTYIPPLYENYVDLKYATDKRAMTATLIPDELYVSGKWKVFNLDLGIKHMEQFFMAPGTTLGSLSSTSGRLNWSGNTRSMPGYTASLDPVAVPFTGKHLYIYGEWGDYLTMDERYIQDALVHRMKAGGLIRFTDNVSFRLGVDHFAQWGGTSPKLGKFDMSVENYLRVATARKASPDGGWSLSDQINVLGNHLGSEFFRLDWRGNGWSFAAQHDIPYDDKSGMTMRNFPDGVNTLALSLDNKDAWVSDIVYEYQYTIWQTGTWHAKPVSEEVKATQDPSDPYYGYVVLGGVDNYNNNEDYMSGWTYYGRSIGNPLFFPRGTKDGSWSSRTMTIGVENNRVRAHHLGLGGKLFHKVPYRLMLTYSMNYGTYYEPYKGESQLQKDWGTVDEQWLSQFSSGLDLEYPLGRGLLLVGGVFADLGELLGTRFGSQIGLRYEFCK